MKNNPFTSNTLTTIWLKHYTKSLSPVNFEHIHNLTFVKNGFFPVFVNVGKNWTKAITYSLDDCSLNNYNNKAFLIYDVPNYIPQESDTKKFALNVLKVPQYYGYLAKLTGFNSLEQYMKSQFDSKSRYKFKRNKKRLQESFHISESIYFGEILKAEYDQLMDSFRNLLQKAFKEKQANTNIIAKWAFYYELIYPMILEKKASLYVLRNEQEPICISLNFHSDSTVFLFFSVYDSDYSKFAIGYMSVMKSIEWCIENKVNAYDFSKGYFHYKERWSNVKYRFDYHILYNPKSLISYCLALVMASYFRLKQKLREKKLNNIYHKALFYLKSKNEMVRGMKNYEYGPKMELNLAFSNTKINIDAPEYSFLKRPLFDYIYFTGEHLSKVCLVEWQGNYWIVGPKHKQKIILPNNQRN